MPTPRKVAFNCVVCAAEATTGHGGVDACRACAAFYKRSIDTGNKLACRKGGNRCAINKSIPFMCRMCRFQKCASAGMKVMQKAATSTEEVDCHTGEIHALTPSPASRLPVVATSSESILDRLRHEWNESRHRRTSMEWDLRRSEKYPNIRVPELSQELYYMTFQFVDDCMREWRGDFECMTKRLFPAFENAWAPDLKHFVSHYSGIFACVEGAFLTLSNIGSIDDFYMITFTSVIDWDGKQFGATGDLDKLPMRNETQQYFSIHIERYRELCDWKLIGQLTEKELLALQLILMWTFDYSRSFPEEMLAFGERVKQEVFDCMHRHYHDDLQLENYAQRLGTLMCIANSMMEVKAYYRVEVAMNRFLDLGSDSGMNGMV